MEKGYIAGLVLCYLSSTSALICLSCSHVRDVRECLKVEECAPHQRCFTNLALDQHGIAMYTLGCIGQSVCDLVPDNMVGKRVSSNNSLEQVNMMKNGRGVTSTSCLQCCNNTDGCNKDLCTAKRFQSNTNTAAVTSQPCNGQTQDIPFVFPKKDTSTRQTKLRCMTCTDVMETKFCDTINECSSDQFCFAHRRMKHESGRHFYELGCMGLKQCAALRHAYLQSCFTCCNQSDFCNYAACDDHPSTHTPTGHSDITSYTTSTVPTTTTPTPQVVIQGKAKDNYMSIASLTCVTVPPAQSYSWKFNGTSRLPPHVFKMGTTQGSALAGTDTLVIANLTEATFGTYTCVVSINGHTVEDTHFIGIIAEKPTVTIEKPPVTNTFALQCKSTGYPMPHLEWDFTPTRIGAHTIPPGVQFNDQGFISTLFVNNYHPRDHDGIWYCEAKNSQGTAIANVQIP